MLPEIALILLLALLNGFFALGEMALMNSHVSRLRRLARSRGSAARAMEMTRRPERFLASVRLFITLICIATGATLGVALGGKLAARLESTGFPLLAAGAMPLGLAASVLLITFANVLFGELLPRRIALLDPEQATLATAWPLRALTAAAAPFAFVLLEAADALSRLARLEPGRHEHVSEDEIRLLVAEGAEQGIIDPAEHHMVNRVLRLGDRSVGSVMTPRTRIAWLDATAPAAENLAIMRGTPYSRYPVVRGDERDVAGILEVKRLIGSLGESEQPDLMRGLGTPLYVPSTTRALDLLEQFRDAGMPLALVVDEYGDIEGLVTLNDVLAAVIGSNATASAAPDRRPIVLREDGSWLVDGSIPAEELRELLDLHELPDDDGHDFHTAAGLAIAHFGRIPQLGDGFDWGEYRVEVVGLDGARVDRLLITRRPAAEPESTAIEASRD